MDNLKNIDDVIFWRTKSNIILTQYAMKDRKVGRFVRLVIIIILNLSQVIRLIGIL